ncbi:DUF5615 family PIN-like protein [Methylosinus sp. LW4]|uniref:DUF5615 family PIN-like protein n=1 Tax=Methylosinus sp. LW4 TaxID=136993 RepID=UPI0003A85E96|nr:DUF5615 family PIN-like protein [Methylosinus sp. LW4]
MRFLVDAQLPPALARWLSAAGHEAEHVGDVGLGDASDSSIWSYALAAGAVVISKDEDFAQRKALESGGPPIVWVRVPNTRKRELLAWFETMLPDILAALERGESLIEVI